ncbi:MAG: glycerophosphodiester phosphodiesterase [Eubacteriales bacterium]
MSEFKFQAHRGDSVSYPENTIVAYLAAVEQGYKIVEMDCKFTKDNVCIMLHDASVNRTCRREDGSELEVKTPSTELTLAEIRALDAGLFKGEQFRGTRIPTLAETLDAMKEKDADIKLDNVFQGFNEEQFEIFCNTIKASAYPEEKLGLTCKTLPYFEYLAAKFPKAHMHYDGYMTEEALKRTYAVAAGRTTYWIPYGNRDVAWFKGRKADPEFCAEVRKYGEIGIWTISTMEELSTSVKVFGATAAETNGQLKPYMLADI